MAWCQGVTTNAALSTKVLDITLPAGRPFSSLAISASRDSASACMAMGFQRKWRDKYVLTQGSNIPLPNWENV